MISLFFHYFSLLFRGFSLLFRSFHGFSLLLRGFSLLQLNDPVCYVLYHGKVMGDEQYCQAPFFGEVL